MRDSTFALWGLYTLGLDREADDFFAFIADVSGANSNERHPLQVMYGVGGERSLVEEELHHLSGYDHARPVRIGNGAYDQVQHDIWARSWTRWSTCTPSCASKSRRRCGQCSRSRWKRRLNTARA